MERKNMGEQTVIAIYNRVGDAERVVKDLINGGFPRENISQESKGTTGMGAKLTDMLTGFGIPIDEARMYQQSVDEGNTLVAVQTTTDHVDHAIDIMERRNPVDLSQMRSHYQEQGGRWTQEGAVAGTTRGTTEKPVDWTTEQPTGRTTERTTERTTGRARGRMADQTEGEVRVPVVEEELQVGKQEVERGGVRVHSRVVEKPVEAQVGLRQERVEVERHPVNRPASEADLETFHEGTVEVTERGEEPVVRKQARVVEEVEVGKNVRQEQRTVRDTVRRTEVEVERMGGERYTQYEPQFRRDFDTRFTGKNYNYDTYAPAYRFGYDLATSRYEGQNWNTVEKQARKDWEQDFPNQPWNDVKDAVHQGWEIGQGKR